MFTALALLAFGWLAMLVIELPADVGQSPWWRQLAAILVPRLPPVSYKWTSMQSVFLWTAFIRFADSQ